MTLTADIYISEINSGFQELIAEFSLTNAGASDEWGTPYIVSTQSASVTLGKVAEVPEPNTIIIMFISLFGCLVFSRRKLKL